MRAADRVAALHAHADEDERGAHEDDEQRGARERDRQHLVDVAHDGALGPDDLDRRRDVGRAAGAGEVGRRVADLAGRAERDGGRAAGAGKSAGVSPTLLAAPSATAGAPPARGKSAGVSPTFAAALPADGEEPGSSSADAALTDTRAPIATSPIATRRSLRTNWRWDFMTTSSGWADLIRGGCTGPVRKR